MNPAMAWAVSHSGPEVIVPFQLDEGEQFVEQSLDDQPVVESSVSQMQELPVLTHLLKSSSSTATSPSIVANSSLVQTAGIPPKKTGSVRLHPVSSADGYKLVIVPNTTTSNSVAWTSHPWYHSTASHVHGTPVALPSSSATSKSTLKTVRIVPQSKTIKQQLEVFSSLTPPTKNATVVHRVAPAIAKPASRNHPVVVISKDRDVAATILRRSLHQSTSPYPGTGCVARAPSLSGESCGADNEPTMPVITSVMSLSNCDFDSIVDNAANAENDKAAARTVEDPGYARSMSRPAPVLVKKVSPTHKTSDSHSLLIRRPANHQDNVSKAAPRTVARLSPANRVKTQLVTSMEKPNHSPGPFPPRKVYGKSGNMPTSVGVCAPLRKVEDTSPGKCVKPKSEKVEVFELDAVKKVGNKIMGSTITFKPSSDHSTNKPGDGETSMIKKLQQAINCFEQSALKSESTFNKVERNMLESVLSQLKGKTTDANLGMETSVPVAPKVVPDASKDGSKEQQNINSSTATNKKPMRKIVITSDSIPSVGASVIKEGIERFLQKNSISNNFTEDEVLNLHWDGKDIGTLRCRSDEKRVPPTVVAVNKEGDVSPKHSPQKPKPTGVTKPQDIVPKLEFKPRIIRVIRRNGQVIEQPLADNCPSLPVVATSLSAKSMPHSSSNPIVTQAVMVSCAPRSSSPERTKIPPTPSTSQLPSGTSQAIIASEPLQTLLKNMRDEDSREKKQYVTAVFPDGQRRKITISAIHVRKEAGDMPDTLGAEAPVVVQGTEVPPDCVLKNEKGSNEMQGRDCLESLCLPSRSDDEFSKMLEPEVLLEESSIALNFSESCSTVSKQSSSDSSYSGNSDSDDTDEEYVAVRPPARRSSNKTVVPSRKQSQVKGRQKAPRQLWGQQGYRKRRRGRSGPYRRNKLSKVEEKATDEPTEPIWAKLRNANAKVVVNCRNCIDNPCIVLMDRLNDEVVKNGRVNMSKVKEDELFSLSATAKVVLSSTQVVEAVRMEPLKADNEEQVKETEKTQDGDDIMQLLLDSRRQLEELRRKYQ